MSGLSRILSEGGTTRIQGNRKGVIHKVVDAEVARRRVSRNQWVTVERQRSLRSRKYSAEVAFLFIQHLLHLFADHRVCERLSARGHLPSMRVSRIVFGVEEFAQRVAEAAAGSGENVSEVGEAGDTLFESCLVTDMRNHSRCYRGGGILLVPFLWAVFAGSDDHVGDILRVTDIAR